MAACVGALAVREVALCVTGGHFFAVTLYTGGHYTAAVHSIQPIHYTALYAHPLCLSLLSLSLDRGLLSLDLFGFFASLPLRVVLWRGSGSLFFRGFVYSSFLGGSGGRDLEHTWSTWIFCVVSLSGILQILWIVRMNHERWSKRRSCNVDILSLRVPRHSSTHRSDRATYSIYR